MKIKCFFSCFVAGVLLGPNNCFSQVVIQHSGASDPLTEGWSPVDANGEGVGPIFGDRGFDAWFMDNTTSGGTPNYHYSLLSDEQNAAITNGWVLSARMRFLEPGMGFFRFQMGTRDHWLTLWMDESGDIAIWDGSSVTYTFVGGGNDYHEYSIVYDPIDEITALWITGIGAVANLSGRHSTPDEDYFVAFGVGQARSHLNWNEVTFAIIPEPATVALLTGLGGLLLVGGIRWRQRTGRMWR